MNGRTVDARPGTEGPRSPALAHVLTGFYAVAALVGVVLTWFYNLRFDGADGQSYLQAWFANDASSSAAVDLIVVAVVACVFMVREGRRLGMRGVWLYVVLTPTVAIAFTFPLFLALRERALQRAAALHASAPDDHAADTEVVR